MSIATAVLGSARDRGRGRGNASDVALDELLLDAKLSPPQPRPGSVSRAELIERARRSERRVVGITAPAGYGKSTLLVEWSEAEDRPVAWVSLDRFDDDPSVLLALLASAYARISPDSTDLTADMRGAGVSPLERAAPRLASVLRASPVPFVLMLDDFHELQSPACHDVMGVVISGIPRNSQLVAASRSEQPHLPDCGLRVTRWSSSRATLPSTRLPPNRSSRRRRLTVTPEFTAAVTERTEGWPVGLYLAALIAKDNDGEALVAGDDRYVADYLYREALLRLPERTQRFLRRTAVLDQLSGPICDALLDEADGAEQLRQARGIQHVRRTARPATRLVSLPRTVP